QGDHLSKIALARGFIDYRTIWDHPNNAELKKKRENPHVLSPGDKVFVPDKEVREESRPTDQRHRFKRVGRVLMLRLALKDFDHEPLADTPCELHVEGTVHALRTDKSGRIERAIPTGAETAMLIFQDPLVPFDLSIPIRIGHLDPVDEVTGQKARLRNLGYFAGPVDGTADEGFGFAVQEFQCDYGLTVDGVWSPDAG